MKKEKEKKKRNEKICERSQRWERAWALEKTRESERVGERERRDENDREMNTMKGDEKLVVHTETIRYGHRNLSLELDSKSKTPFKAEHKASLFCWFFWLFCFALSWNILMDGRFGCFFHLAEAFDKMEKCSFAITFHKNWVFHAHYQG